MGQVLEDSKNVGAAMEGRLRKTLEISSYKHPQTDICLQFVVLPVLLGEGEFLQKLFHRIRLSKRSSMLRLIKRPA